MGSNFSFIDHTGDLGIRVWGESPQVLFLHAAEAFFHIITDRRRIRKRDSRRISLRADGLEELLVTWLNEFVFLFDAEGLLFTHFQILSLDEHRIEAIARGEVYEEGRHPIKTTIKGATYHQLRIYQQGGMWEAQVIFDL